MTFKQLLVSGILSIVSAVSLAHSSNDEYYVGDFWSGEYPGPVIKVVKNTALRGTFTLPKADQPNPKSVVCTIKKGVYHPWATKTKAKYYSTTGVRDYTANKPTILELDQATGVKKLAIEQGEKVQFLAYYGEGYCLLKAKGIQGSAPCLDDNDYTTTKTSDYYTQHLKVKCLEGNQAYIAVTDDLFKIKGIIPGNIKDYGSVEE